MKATRRTVLGWLLGAVLCPQLPGAGAPGADELTRVALLDAWAKLDVGFASNGGYLVPQEFANELMLRSNYFWLRVDVEADEPTEVLKKFRMEVRS